MYLRICRRSVRRYGMCCNLRVNELAAGEDSLVGVARKLVRAVAMPEGFSYTRDIQSPALQQYYSILQALALNQDQPEWAAERDDTMVPDREKFAELEDSVFGRFKALAGLSDEMMHAPAKV
jgi:hypothetical protein